MKSRAHDEAMAEYFRSRPTYAVRLLAEVCRDGDPAEVAILIRQMAGALEKADGVRLLDTEWLLPKYKHGIFHGIY